MRTYKQADFPYIKYAPSEVTVVIRQHSLVII